MHRSKASRKWSNESFDSQRLSEASIKGQIVPTSVDMIRLIFVNQKILYENMMFIGTERRNALTLLTKWHSRGR